MMSYYHNTLSSCPFICLGMHSSVPEFLSGDSGGAWQMNDVFETLKMGSDR